jgi:hypothetical protein
LRSSAPLRECFTAYIGTLFAVALPSSLQRRIEALERIVAGLRPDMQFTFVRT